MKRGFAPALGAVLTGMLVLAATSGGDARLTDAWKGKFRNSGGAKITIRAKVVGGEATKIKAMRYRDLPATCPRSGADTINGRWTFEGVDVNDRRKFRVVGVTARRGGQSSIRFKGRFSRNFNKVRGRLQTNQYFADPPAETCVSESKRYRARR